VSLCRERRGHASHFLDTFRRVAVSIMIRMASWTPETITLLYRQWAPRIFNHFRRLRWTVEDASDLTSEVFTIALERLPQLREGERFGGWLWSIANHQAANRLRSDQRRHERERVVLEETAHNAAAGNRDHCLARALDALQPAERQLLLWREYSGLNYREIARMTGQSAEGVRASLYRARVRLREEYRKRME
jgi:RNA polymerase sigma-70 factor (ECF subfamily)